ncbi:MAG: polysaccharide biosynthesis/export family protein [Bacteroidales bacterium]|nr:polysaccharide biosynthesis/export family protein [Bacteroidales bacterium]
MITRVKSTLRPALILFLVIAASSCVPSKKLKYFNDIDDIQAPYVSPQKDKAIAPGDRLFIRVLSIDEEANQIFNSVDNITANNTSNIIGYGINQEGNIDFPFVGKVKLSGMTIAEASEKMTGLLKEYVPGSEVVIKYIDNRVTVMGEVNAQGVYSFSEDKINIYKALALGGGLTRWGNRENVVLMRNENGRITHYKLDLSSSEIAGKDQFYVRPNDVVVVEPLKRISASYQNTTFNTVLGALSTIITILIFAGVSPGN